MEQPGWMALAWRELGQRERAGRADNPRIVDLYRDAGHAGVAHDEVAWCAAFVGAMLERSGIKGTGSLLARSYAKWGEEIAEPRLGAIAVLSRGRDPTFGHVGFVVGATKYAVILLGGNQGDSVSVAAFDKARLLALRWPSRIGSGADQSPAGIPRHNPQSAFDEALAHVLQMEGGYSDDPHDPGGPTNKGIILSEFAAFKGVTLDARNRAAMKTALKSISDEDVRTIYEKRYWVPSEASDLAPALALMHFDAAVNHGTGSAIRMLQQAVGVEADGEIGPRTRAAIAAVPLARVLATYAELRRQRYRKLPHFWRFGNGWLRRVDTTLARAAALITTTKGNTFESEKGMKTMANEKKPAPKWWGQSMTIWGVVMTAVAAIAPTLGPLIGIDIPAEIISQTDADVSAGIQAIMGLVGSVLAIYGRLRASQPLQRREMSIKL